MTARRLRILFPVAGLIAGILLAITPQSYRSPGGFQGKAGIVESQVVDCGIALSPQNPPPPPGSNEDCDAQHTRRGAIIVIVVAAGLILGAMMGFAERLRRRRQAVAS